MTQADFLSIILQPGETTTFTDTPFGTSVSHAPKKADYYYCINPLLPTEDRNPTRPHHNANIPRRADANIVSFRNFLLELDSGTVEEQRALVTARLPVSAITYSGNKSLHFIVSLQEPLLDLHSYRIFAQRLLKLVPEADPTCKNPSRLSRLPFAINPETGKTQDLLYLGYRLSYSQLDAVLPKIEDRKFKVLTEAEAREYVSPLLVWASQKPEEVMQEHGIQGRNAFMYWVGCRMTDANLSLDARAKWVEIIYNKLQSKEDFSLSEAFSAARVRGH